METANTDMLRGRVDIFVLKALSENDGYGYDILNYIHSRTEGHYEMKQSSVYSVLKRLEKQGYVSSYMGDETNGAKRRYYSLTDFGKRFLEEEEKEWAYTRTLLDNLVSDKDFDLKNDTPPFHPSDLRPLTKRSPREGEVADDTPVDLGEDKSASAEVKVISDTNTAITTDRNVVSATKTETSPIPAAKKEEIIDNSVLKTDSTEKTDDNKTDEAAATLIDENYAFSRSPHSSDGVPDENSIRTETYDFKRSEDTQRNGYAVKDNYRDFFGSLFNASKSEPTEKTSAASELDRIDCSHINDLRGRLDDEGIKLKSYEPRNSGKGLMRYVLVNRLFRDTVILAYLFLIVSLLVVYLCKPFEVTLNAVLIIGGIGLVVPVIALLMSLNSPEKKKKDNINVKIVMAVSLIIYLAFFIINIIISLIIPNGHSLNSAATYAPCIVCLVIPLSGLFFTILYKTDNYHLKK